jgi:hypothetical protein
MLYNVLATNKHQEVTMSQRHGNSLADALRQGVASWEGVLGAIALAEIDEALSSNNKIRAILFLRDNLGCDLSLAKEAIEARSETKGNAHAYA